MKNLVNVGRIDQIIRFVLAVVFLVLSFTVSVWFIIGTVIALVTASIKVCPLYMIFGLKTTKKEDKK